MNPRSDRIIVIGAGFAGLSAAASLAADGHSVTVLEKHDQPGGRARVLHQQGFAFDMGPSWYWMPDVMERFFGRFDKKVSDYFSLVRLDPSYQVIFSDSEAVSLPADFVALQGLFEEIEPGSGSRLKEFLEEAGRKYEASMRKFVYKPCLSVSEFASFELLSSLFSLDLMQSFSTHARKFFRDPRILQIIEFPVLFLGASPARTPAMYSIMNYADMKLGTWYPMGGMHKLVEAMASLAGEMGADIRLSAPVSSIRVENRRATGVVTSGEALDADLVLAGADYHHVEQHLLEPEYRTYSEKYWDSRTMAPSCLLYYIGLDIKLGKLEHHNLFFDADYERHAASIYDTKSWPEKPLFYTCCPSATDPGVAPAGHENLFVLIPVAAGLDDTPEIRAQYFQMVLGRLERFCGESISEHIVYSKSYAGSDFTRDYNAFKGNAYGLANTLKQTAMLKPSLRSKKVKNLFYTGQLTVPGPGVPPSIISGQVAADYIKTRSRRQLV